MSTGSQQGKGGADESRSSAARRWAVRFRAAARHPLSFLTAVVVLSLVIEEEYPFSHYPMYSKLVDSTHYLYLTDADGQLLPFQEVTGEKTTTVKKAYHSVLGRLAREHEEATGEDISGRELGPEADAEAGRAVLERFVMRALERDFWQEHPDAELRLMSEEIRFRNNRLETEKRLIVSWSPPASSREGNANTGAARSDQ